MSTAAISEQYIKKDLLHSEAKIDQSIRTWGHEGFAGCMYNLSSRWM